jgi:hypothetical protein
VKRRLLNFFTTVLLLMCVAVVALWVRSHWVSEDVYSQGLRFYQRHRPIGYAVNLRSAAGGVLLSVSSPDAPLTPRELERIRENFPRQGWEINRFPPKYPTLRTARFVSRFGATARPPPPDPPQPQPWRLLGVDWKTEQSRTAFAYYTVYEVVFPYWMPAALLALLPAVRLGSLWHKRRREARSARALCGSCGYDLRATPGRCPECGAVPTPS